MADLRLTLPPELIREIAEQAADIVMESQIVDGWLSVSDAADYAGTTKHSILKAIAAGELEAAQPSGPRGRYWLKRSYVDAWRTA